jgi:transposase-like protein
MAFLDMSNHRVLFSTAFKEDVVRRVESGEALATVSKELGIARKLLCEWRWAWRRHAAAGLNRRRGPKKGLRRRRASKSRSVWLVANNSTSIFFARPCDLPTRFLGPQLAGSSTSANCRWGKRKRVLPEFAHWRSDASHCAGGI